MNISTHTRTSRLSKYTSSMQLQKLFTILVFLAPALVLFTVFLIYPIAQSAYYSLFNWKGFGPAIDFVALDNYSRILSDKNFLRAVQNSLLIVALSVALQLPLALILALMVGRSLPGRAFFRVTFFLPYVLSEVITAVIWRSLYHPDPHYGLINAILVNLDTAIVPWLGDVKTVMPAIFVVLTWKYFGFHMLLYMAGLQSIPADLEDAAKIDGATSFQTIWYIIIPLLRSTIRTTVYLSVLGSIQLFDLVWILTEGGPAGASEVMATYLYRFGFIRFYLGYGSAVAVVMFMICIAFSLIYQNVFKEQEYVGGYGA
ncbi:MAG: sugar ABC transporter permease [Anaerolineales bacterium]|nr:sugar ABC transporter permease [Anaerolineales bacterium]